MPVVIVVQTPEWWIALTLLPELRVPDSVSLEVCSTSTYPNSEPRTIPPTRLCPNDDHCQNSSVQIQLATRIHDRWRSTDQSPAPKCPSVSSSMQCGQSPCFPAPTNSKHEEILPAPGLSVNETILDSWPSPRLGGNGTIPSRRCRLSAQVIDMGFNRAMLTASTFWRDLMPSGIQSRPNVATPLVVYFLSG